MAAYALTLLRFQPLLAGPVTLAKRFALLRRRRSRAHLASFTCLLLRSRGVTLPAYPVLFARRFTLLGRR